MDSILLNGKTVTFIAPSGSSYTLREQNGEDDDVLSNPMDAKNLMNISKFIAGIVIGTDVNTKGKLTPDEAHNLPTLDRYCILLNSRINSLGDILEFKYEWSKDDGGPRDYEVDINDYLLDYSIEATAEIREQKPDALPHYSVDKTQDLELTLNSGKRIMIDLLTGRSEGQLVNIPENEKTKNSELIVRNLRLYVETDNAWVKVNRFNLFTTRDMQEIRNFVKKADPPFYAKTEVENPTNGQVAYLNIMSLPDFFYLGEM